MGNIDRYFGVAASTSQGSAVADIAAVTSSQNGALTSGQEATADAAVQSGSYVQADVASIRTLANSLKAKYNAAQTDLAALRTSYQAAQVDIAALRTTLLALQDSLQAASVIAP